QPVAPYMIPIDTTGVEPGFASFLPQPERRLVAGLNPRQGILSESAAKLRHLGVGSTLTFSTGDDVTIVGTLPDVLMGGYELLVDRATAAGIGVTHERYILFQVRPAAHPTALQLAQRFVPYLPIDVAYPMVEVRDLLRPGRRPHGSRRTAHRESVRRGDPAQPGHEPAGHHPGAAEGIDRGDGSLGIRVGGTRRVSTGSLVPLPGPVGGARLSGAGHQTSLRRKAKG